MSLLRKVIVLLLLLTLFSASALAEAPDFPRLTEDSFPADDVPEAWLLPCAAPGRVEKVRYTTSDENREVKSVMVYLPADYDSGADAYIKNDYEPLEMAL